MEKNKNAFNLVVIVLVLVTVGCSCNKLAELARNESNSATRPDRPVNTSAVENTGDWDAPSNRKGEYDLTMEMYERLKVGMPRAEAEAILGGKGTEMSSSKGGGMSFSVNKWDGDQFRSIILSFKNDKIMTKSQVGLK